MPQPLPNGELFFYLPNLRKRRWHKALKLFYQKIVSHYYYKYCISIVNTAKICYNTVIERESECLKSKNSFAEKGQMMKITREAITDFLGMIQQREVSRNTMTAYKQDLNALLQYAGDRELTKETMLQYKEYLASHYKTETANRRLRTARQFLNMGGQVSSAVKPIPVKRNLTPENLMTLSDFERMLRYADKLNRPRERAIMETLVGTGIRFNELQFITYEAVKTGVVTVQNKGAVRDVPLQPVKKILLNYCKENGITTGVIFRTRYGNPISNSQLSRELKKIAGAGRVSKARIHPHGFRHLFAVNYLESGGNTMELKNILGHQSLETTSIYTRLTAKQLGAKMTATSILNKLKKKTRKK